MAAARRREGLTCNQRDSTFSPFGFPMLVQISRSEVLTFCFQVPNWASERMWFEIDQSAAPRSALENNVGLISK